MKLARIGLVLGVLVAGCAHNPAPRPHVGARQAADDRTERETARPEAAETGYVGPVAHPDPVEAAESAADRVARLSGTSSRAGDATIDTLPPGTWHLPIASFAPNAVIGRFGDPRGGGTRSHEGIDIGAPRGTVVVAPVAGRISVSGTRSLGGNVVVLVDDSREYEFVFSHLDSRLVQRGQPVGAGELLGTVGTTGNAQGGPPHLHFEVHYGTQPIDPYPLLTRTAFLLGGR